MNYSELCERITNQIIVALETDEAGTWSAPWHQVGAGWAPCNAKTGNWYGGSNVIVLACEAIDAGYQSPLWSTYRQWADLGGQVKRGERATQIVKWVPKAKGSDDSDKPAPTTPDGQPMNRLHGPKLVPKVYSVFNVAQVDGWQPPSRAEPIEHTPIDTAEAWIAASDADVSVGHDHACYLPVQDRIEVPALAQFDDPLDYYSTVAHELIHFTGAKHRLRRDLSGRFGDDAYAAEELVAELGAAFTAGRLGLANTPRPDHIHYLAHWLRILKADPKALFAAASQAQRAVDYIAGLDEPDPEDSGSRNGGCIVNADGASASPRVDCEQEGRIA